MLRGCEWCEFQFAWCTVLCRVSLRDGGDLQQGSKYLLWIQYKEGDVVAVSVLRGRLCFETELDTSTSFAEGQAWLEIGKNRGICMEVRSQMVLELRACISEDDGCRELCPIVEGIVFLLWSDPAVSGGLYENWSILLPDKDHLQDVLNGGIFTKIEESPP